MKQKQTVELKNDILQDEEEVETDLDEKASQLFHVEDEEVLCTGVKPAPPSWLSAPPICPHKQY
eukprot:4102240-Ditylum_brightwellii.AAC.1